MNTLPNIHTRELLLAKFLTAMDISQNRLARAMDVPSRRINEVVHGQRANTLDTALRLSCALSAWEKFPMGPQADYALKEARNLRATGSRNVKRSQSEAAKQAT